MRLPAALFAIAFLSIVCLEARVDGFIFDVFKLIRNGVRDTAIQFATNPMFRTMSNMVSHMIPQLDEKKLAAEQLAAELAVVASQVKYIMFSREHPTGKQFHRNVTEIVAAGFKASRPTRVFLHGWGNSVESESSTTTVLAFLMGGDYNIIAMDWSALCPITDYTSSRENVPPVGKELARTVDFLANKVGLRLADLHLIGHSLGAHVAGVCGREVTAGRISRVTGLDPAKPQFEDLPSSRLARGDGLLVDVIHTCGGSLGLLEPLGDVDFYPNGGQCPQPGCVVDLLTGCSHGRAFELFAESITSPNSFAAVLCESVTAATSGECSDGSNGTDANMGYHLQYRKPGLYYLETEGSQPFDLVRHRLQEERALREMELQLAMNQTESKEQEQRLGEAAEE